MRVSLFVTCFNDTLFPRTGQAAVEILERLGCEIDFPLEQTCCGQMHVNSGYEHEAAGLLERFPRVGARRRGGERDRGGDRTGARRRRGHQGQVAGHRRDRDERGARRRGIRPTETDQAELIVQLGHDRPSHILVPAIHRNRAEIRALFERTIARGQELGTEAGALTEAARAHLRAKFLSVPVAVSGANFGMAETGTVVVVESEGNGRMCVTLPRVLITVMGIEKVLPEWRDLEVFLQLLPRSSTAERMNPYTSLWTGVRPDDGPREFHLILLDGGRTRVLADAVGRQALHCIRCSACLNVSPVYERVGGQAYESVYPGPIGAILTPQLHGLDAAPSLPWASSLCGACFDACPVRIDIPTVLVHLRGRVVREEKSKLSPEALAMKAAAAAFSSRGRFERAQRLAWLGRGPLAKALVLGWTAMRDLPEPPKRTFRDWWRERPKADV